MSKRYNQRSSQFATTDEDPVSGKSYGQRQYNTVTPIMAQQFYSINQAENGQLTLITRIRHPVNNQSFNQSVTHTVNQSVALVSLVGQAEQLLMGPSMVQFELHDGTGIVRVKCFNNKSAYQANNNDQSHDSSMDPTVKSEETYEHSLLSRIQPHSYVRVTGKSVLST